MASSNPDQLPPDDDNEEIDEGEQTPDAGPVPGASTKPKKKKKGKGKASGAAEKLKEVLKPGTSLEKKLSPELHQTIIQNVRQQNGDEMADQIATMNRSELGKILDQLKVLEVAQGKTGIGGKNKKDMADHKFWATQPVRRLDENDEDFEEGEIEPSKSEDQIRPLPYPLPAGYEWSTMDLTSEEELREVYELLTLNYVEDDDAMFRFDYSAAFIDWALRPPGYIREWHIGLRVSTGKRKLVAFIAGIPMNLRVRNGSKHSVEINFLCIHKRLRSKRLAPVMIKEVTRRCHLRGIFHAIYTAGVFLPTPIARCQYFHRNLNPSKLVATGFSAQPRGVSIARLNRTYALPTECAIPGFREMVEGDVKAVGRLVRRYMSRFEMVPLMDDKEIAHACVKGRGEGEAKNGRRDGQVTWCYVVEDPETHLITDVVSFYHLPSTAMKTTPHQIVDAAYLFLYATTAAPACEDLGTVEGVAAAEKLEEDEGVEAVIGTVGGAKGWLEETGEERRGLKKRLVALISEALSVAQQAKFDVFNALTLMDNTLFVQDLLFGAGDGYLHYYLYNWKVHNIRGGVAAERGAPQDTGAHFTEQNGSGVGVVML